MKKLVSSLISSAILALVLVVLNFNVASANEYTYVLLYSKASNHNSIDQDTLRSLQKIAFEQAQIWGDTILEGDYYADGQTVLEEVYGVFKNNQIIGYKISYSEKAWYTGECRFDGQNESLLNECQNGKIVEASIVSSDLQSFDINGNGAEFIEE